jgi:hypothetical protein
MRQYCIRSGTHAVIVISQAMLLGGYSSTARSRAHCALLSSSAQLLVLNDWRVGFSQGYMWRIALLTLEGVVGAISKAMRKQGGV